LVGREDFEPQEPWFAKTKELWVPSLRFPVEIKDDDDGTVQRTLYGLPRKPLEWHPGFPVDTRNAGHGRLGIREGATENGAACKDLLQNLVERGLNPELERLFVIDGSKALRRAINAVFGTKAPVQRCRQHKLRNVVERLPREQQAQTRSLIRAAWKLEAKEGMARLRKLAEWLREDYPDAASSLLEGMEECFTINRLNIPFSLHRCLATTNLIESSQSGVRMRTRRVCRWRATMPARWVAAAFLATENNFRRIMGYRDLWALKAILRGEKEMKPKQAVA
jgi:putative transposase